MQEKALSPLGLTLCLALKATGTQESARKCWSRSALSIHIPVDLCKLASTPSENRRGNQPRSALGVQRQPWPSVTKIPAAGRCSCFFFTLGTRRPVALKPSCSICSGSFESRGGPVRCFRNRTGPALGKARAEAWPQEQHAGSGRREDWPMVWAPGPRLELSAAQGWPRALARMRGKTQCFGHTGRARRRPGTAGGRCQVTRPGRRCSAREVARSREGAALREGLLRAAALWCCLHPPQRKTRTPTARQG